MSGSTSFKEGQPQGVGVGLRSIYYQQILEELPAVPWFEAVSENYIGLEGKGGGRPLSILLKVRENYPIVLHGVSLSIGSTDPLDKNYLNSLKRLIERVEPAWVSDHLCWTGVGGENLHDLLPLPYTKEAIDHISERILKVQDFLGQQIAIENVSSYLTYTHSEMEEWDFINAIVKKADCKILLDVNNIYVSSVNHQYDPLLYLEAVPRDRVQQFHLAGYSDNGDHLVDTHDHPVTEPVWKLFESAVERFGDVPTLIEWDDQLPDFETLLQEAAKARVIFERINGKHTDAQTKPTVAEMGLH